MTARLLFVHAHPDDETITTGGTIAKYAAQGAEVSVLTCTLGEEGDVIDEKWHGLHSSLSNQLGGIRAWELSMALERLGGRAPLFLGYPGRWRDTGMAGATSSTSKYAFANSSTAEVVEALSIVIRQLRPHVVVTYDPGGGYGHPDHVRANEVTQLAVKNAADPSAYRSDPRTSWTVPKVYWVVTESSDLRAGLARIAAVRMGCRVPKHEELFSVPDSAVTSVVDVSDYLDAKVLALHAHRTQLVVEDSNSEFTVSSGIVQPILPREHFILASGGNFGSGGREYDLLNGIDTDEY